MTDKQYDKITACFQNPLAGTLNFVDGYYKEYYPEMRTQMIDEKTYNAFVFAKTEVYEQMIDSLLTTGNTPHEAREISQNALFSIPR